MHWYARLLHLDLKKTGKPGKFKQRGISPICNLYIFEQLVFC